MLKEFSVKIDRVDNPYNFEMVKAFLAYGVLLIVSIILTEAYADAAWRFAVALAPIVPFVYGIGVYMRYLRRANDLERRIAMESLSIAFGGAVAVTLGYGFLQSAGLSPVNWMYIWPIMGALWMLGTVIARRRCR